MSNTLKQINPLKLVNLSSDPSSAENGSLYYNTTSNKVRQYLNGAWADVSAGSVSLTGQALNDGEIIVGNASNLSAAVDTDTVGDVQADHSGGLTIKSGVIVDAQVSSSAAIARSKLASGNANRVVVNDASGVQSDAAAITASRALVSDSNGIPTHSSVTSTELGYVSGVTSAIQTQLNNRPIPQAPSVNAWVYVSQQGSDVTGDGTYHKPFATTAAANAIITDASTSKRYGIHIKGTITETNIYLRPFIWYYGDAWGLSRLNASSGSVTLHATEFTSGNSRCGMTNVYLTGSTGISLDYVSVSASGSHVVEIQDIGVNGSVVITPNNTNQYFQWRGSICFSNFTIHGAGGLFTDTFFNGNLTIDNGSIPVANPGANFISSFVAGNLSITSSGVTNLVQLSGCSITGTTTIDGANVELQTDVSSLGLNSTVSILNSATLTRLSDSANLKYVPTTSSDWISAPSQVTDALDKLAKASPQLSSTITLNDNTSSATTFLTYAKSNTFASLEYSISRGSNYKLGNLLIVNDGTNVNLADSGASEIGTSGVTITASISGSNVIVQYTTTNSGTNANFKHYFKKWS